jgi:hypothetical protein
MNTPGDLKEQMAAKSNEELLDVLAKPADWMPEALAAAKEELDKRQVDIQLPEQKEPRPVARNITGLTNFLTFALELAVLLTGLAIAFDLLKNYSLEHEVGERTSMLLHGGLTAVSILRLVWVVVVLITFYFWVYFMSNNVRALGAEGLKYGPVWAIGCFFVPIVCLWKPFQMMEELWKASQNPKAWREIEQPSILGFWWAGWIFSSFLGFFSWSESRSAGIYVHIDYFIGPNDQIKSQLHALYYLFIFTHIILIGFYLATRKLVSGIAQGQDQAKNQTEAAPN